MLTGLSPAPPSFMCHASTGVGAGSEAWGMADGDGGWQRGREGEERGDCLSGVGGGGVGSERVEGEATGNVLDVDAYSCALAPIWMG